MHVIIDARDGHELDSWDGIETATAPGGVGTGFFSGTVDLTTNTTGAGFELKDPTRGNQYTTDLKGATSGAGAIFTEIDNLLWGNGALTDRQTVGVDAQFGAAKTWDYYLNVHGRNGIANDGKGAFNRVHYGSKYNNAFWTDSCFCMTYGDGDGTTYNPFDSLDVAGHEMSHGVTSRTAKLSYSRESGGLNEATSDIFGTMVEFYADKQEDAPDYDVGERLYITSGEALRYMYQPSKDGRSADCWYKQVGNLNVHYSSGVANHLFYLLAEGTASAVYPPSKTCNATDTRTATGTGVLAGIGRSKAEKIWYRALTTYMTSNTNYAGARIATVKAANDLVATGVLTSDDLAAVGKAWTAVNVQ
jgi:Zn-dependent metalloprotease